MQKTGFFKFAALALVGALSQGAFAAPDGTINFTGEITDAPCSISPASQNIIVPLGSVSRTALDGAVGKRAPMPAKFAIDLLNCGASAKGATVAFTGVPDLNDNTTLAIANTGMTGVQKATGVAIELGDSNGSKIPLGSQSAEYVLGQGDNSLNFQAIYVATQPAVTVGPANAVAQFTVTYP
ncbi:fimbrial protein [Variovorax sp. GT1P44]|uniref:fimbrial protein n=1 Tax=Variovorax sp. GT1P44 TaxID=3443742 RepID=UPI003F4459FF